MIYKDSNIVIAVLVNKKGLEINIDILLTILRDKERVEETRGLITWAIYSIVFVAVSDILSNITPYYLLIVSSI